MGGFYNSGAPYARLHPQYRWPIGAPLETHPAADFAKYALATSAGTTATVFGRQFSNGFAVYNPYGVFVSVVSLPGGPYLDPSTR